MNRRLIKGNKGFTLIELLVVITILGLLVGLTAPAMVEYVSSSKIDKCVSERDGLAASFKSLLGDYSVDDAWAIWIKDVSVTKCDNEFYKAKLADDKKSFTITCPNGHGESNYTIDNEETIAAPEISTGVTESAKPTETTSKVSIGEPEASTEATTTVTETTTEPISTTIVETSTPAAGNTPIGVSWNGFISNIINEWVTKTSKNDSLVFTIFDDLKNKFIYYDNDEYYIIVNSSGIRVSYGTIRLCFSNDTDPLKIPTMEDYFEKNNIIYNYLKLSKKIFTDKDIIKGPYWNDSDETLHFKGDHMPVTGSIIYYQNKLYVFSGTFNSSDKWEYNIPGASGQWIEFSSNPQDTYKKLLGAGFTLIS